MHTGSRFEAGTKGVVPIYAALDVPHAILNQFGKTGQVLLDCQQPLLRCG
jgi:hypothetical protein